MRSLSFAALVALLLAPVGYLAGTLTKGAMNVGMLGATVLWFATVPFWMGRTKESGGPLRPKAVPERQDFEPTPQP